MKSTRLLTTMIAQIQQVVHGSCTEIRTNGIPFPSGMGSFLKPAGATVYDLFSRPNGHSRTYTLSNIFGKTWPPISTSNTGPGSSFPTDSFHNKVDHDARKSDVV
jgi:hypothetical protein